MAAGGSELNLIPYLDIVVTLTVAIFAMVMTVADLGQAPVTAPPVGEGEGKAPLSLDIGHDGIRVRADGDQVLLAREGEAWPTERLTEVLRGLRDAGEASGNVTISAAPDIPYDALLATMDAARSDAAGPLYPGVALAVAAR